MDHAELLANMAATLRSDIGPAVGEEYPRTQAYMASVILDKVSRELALASGHADAEAADMADLIAALGPLLSDAPADVGAAFERVQGEGRVAALGSLIDGLYRWGPGEPTVVEALGRIRAVLRRDIDRRMEIAR